MFQATPTASEHAAALAGNETFIQQKSLALLPLLCRFPQFTPSASDRLVKLIVLVSKRLNPKELWLGLDSVFETSRVGLEALADYDGEGDFASREDEEDDGFRVDGHDETLNDSPEHISLYLSRALLAVQIGKSL